MSMLLQHGQICTLGVFIVIIIIIIMNYNPTAFPDNLQNLPTCRTPKLQLKIFLFLQAFQQIQVDHVCVDRL